PTTAATRSSRSRRRSSPGRSSSTRSSGSSATCSSRRGRGCRERACASTLQSAARPELAVITVCDVGPRDGLQNEADVLAVAVRAELVSRLSAARLPRVEAVSFVRGDRVPQMDGAEEVVALIERRPGTALSGLVLNARGYERFAAARLDRVNCTLAATETFNRRNGNASLDEAVDRVAAIVASASVPVTVTVSCAWGCPFEGEVDPAAVAALCERLADADELVLADTIGVATPRRVRRLLERVSILGRSLGAHLHNTRNTGYACAWSALDAGAVLLDASVGGVGG